MVSLKRFFKSLAILISEIKEPPHSPWVHITASGKRHNFKHKPLRLFWARVKGNIALEKQKDDIYDTNEQ
jgi:hypothetical protein